MGSTRQAVNSKLERAIALIDGANGQDPNYEVWFGQEYPKELLYSQRMSAWLYRLESDDAPDVLQIAARAQHICRWMVPRDDFPKTRVGYLTWRTGLYKFHADKATAIMRDVGYDEESIGQVRKILLKRGLKRDPFVQTIEDIACLVFIENYFEDFSRDYDGEKVISVVRKTWRKMSERAQQAALSLDLPATAKILMAKALA